MSENGMFFLVSFISLLFLVSINYFRIFTSFRTPFNVIFLCESVLLSFFFAKYPILFSLPLVLFCLYYLILNTINTEIPNKKADESIIPIQLLDYFRYIGFLLLILILIYEYFGDRTFSSSGLLVLILALLFLFFDKISSDFTREKEFALVFFSLLTLYFIFPMVSYKILDGSIGSKTYSPGFIENEQMVYLLLVKPLSLVLTIGGYEHYISGQYIHINDIHNNEILIVSIAESCSGIYSIIVFSCALISYLVTEYRNLDLRISFFILSFGIFISYLANLLRMTIIILAGHYKGMTVLLFVHQHIGWLIFTFWLIIFWYFIESLISLFGASAKYGNFNQPHN